MISSFELELDLQEACKADIPPFEILEGWINTTLQAHPSKLHHPLITLTLRVVDVEEIQMLNSTYRNKDKPTNVLSFPSLMSEDMNQLFDQQELGDIVLCASIVERQAHEQHKDLQAHWAHMVVHSTLHLLGYDHVLEDQAQEMESYEKDILKTLGFADPYQSDYEEKP